MKRRMEHFTNNLIILPSALLTLYIMDNTLKFRNSFNLESRYFPVNYNNFRHFFPENLCHYSSSMINIRRDHYIDLYIFFWSMLVLYFTAYHNSCVVKNNFCTLLNVKNNNKRKLLYFRNVNMCKNLNILQLKLWF